jgi:hypothetical protein
MGHSSTNILHTYAKAIDEYRRSAISKLEALRAAHDAQPPSRSEKEHSRAIQ